MTAFLRARTDPAPRHRKRARLTVGRFFRCCQLVLGLALALVAGLLPALDPLLTPFGGPAVARAATVGATVSAPAGGSANSGTAVPTGKPGPRLPLSDPIYPPIDAESATVAGGWRDGTTLLPLSGAAQGQLDPLKLYDLTDISTMVRIPALSTQACPAALQNLHVLQRSGGAPSQPVTYVCSGSPAENLHGNFPAGAPAFRVLAPAPGQPLTGETVGPLPAGSATNPDLADSVAYVRQGTTAHTDNSTFANSVTSMGMGLFAGDPVLLFHSEDPRYPGDGWTAYMPLDSSAITDLFRRQLRGQDAPKRLHPIETTTAADDPANSLFTFYHLPTRSSAVDASHCGGTAPCFEYDWQQSGSWRVGGYAVVIPEMVSLFLPDGRLTATVPDSAVGLGYPHGDPPAGGLEPWMVVNGGGLLVAPLSSPLGRELFASIWSPSHGSWSFRASLSKTARAALVTAQSSTDAPQAPVPVSSAEFAYYTKALGLPPSQFVVKDTYTGDEVKDWVRVDPANLNSVIADGEQHYVVDSPGAISTITTNPSTAANVVGLGMGVALRDGQYRPALLEQTLPGLLGLRWLDSSDDATVQLFQQSYEGRLGRYRPVGRPSEAPPVNVPLNTRSATTFVGSVAAAEVVRSLPWKTITDQGYAVAQVGFGCYQQLANRSPVGPCVKAVAARLAVDGRTWLFTPNSADSGQVSALRNSVLPLRDGTPDPNVTGLFGWQEWGQVADFMSQQGIADTVATYDLARTAGGLAPAKQQLSVALQAKAILQNGKKFPFTNGGRDVLTPTEAGELFDARAVNASIADTTKDPGVRADIVETTKDVAALADAEVSSTPLSELRFTDLGVADVISLTTLNGARASLNQQRMALRAAAWIWQELRARAAQASVTTFGATVPAVLARLHDAYPEATDQDVNVAVMNAFVLLHIDNDAILAALAANQGHAFSAEVLAKLAMRSFLDPTPPASINHTCTSARVAGDSTDLQWGTSYAGLWGFLQTCVRNTFNIPAPAAWTAAGANPASDVVSAAWRDVGSIVTSGYSVQRGAKRANLLAEQVIAIDAAGFSQWAGTDSGWASLKSGVNDSASRVMTLLAKIGPKFASAVAAMVAVDAAGDDVVSIRIGDLPDSALTSAFNFALDVWLTIARTGIRISGLVGSIANAAAALYVKANFDSAVMSLTSLFKEYGGDYRITDLDKLKKLLDLPAAAELPGVTFLNRIGSIGTIAAFFSLGLMIWRYTAGGGPVSAADIISVVSTVTTVFSLSSHIITLGASAMVWGQKWDSYLDAANSALGLGEMPQHNWKLLMSDENGFRSRVLASKIAVAAANGELTKGSDLKSIIDQAHFQISDDAAARLFADLEAHGSRLANAFKVQRAVQPLTGVDPLENLVQNLNSRLEEEARNASSGEELRELGPLREENSGMFPGRPGGLDGTSGPDLGASTDQLGDETANAELVKEYENLKSPSSENLFAEFDTIESDVKSPADIANAVSVEVVDSPSDPTVDDPVNEIKDKVAASLKNREVVFRTVGIAIGLAIQAVMALCDFVGGVFTIVLGILSLRDGGTAADRASAWLTIMGGIAFALAGVLEFVGTALAAAVLLPLFAVALLILVVSLLVKLLQKKHPDKDDATLGEWIAPFDHAGLLKRGWLSRNDLEAWHNNGWGMDTTLQQCDASSGTVTCLGRGSTAPRRPLGRLVNVATQQCVGVKRPASDPIVPAATAEMGSCSSPSYVDEQPSRGGHGASFGWEVVQPYGSDTKVLWALIDPSPGLPAAAKCLLPGNGGALSCPHDYTHGDGGASQPGIWTVEEGPAPGQFRLKDPTTGMYLAAARDSQTPFLSNVPDSPYELWALS